MPQPRCSSFCILQSIISSSMPAAIPALEKCPPSSLFQVTRHPFSGTLRKSRPYHGSPSSSVTTEALSARLAKEAAGDVLGIPARGQEPLLLSSSDDSARFKGLSRMWRPDYMEVASFSGSKETSFSSLSGQSKDFSCACITELGFSPTPFPIWDIHPFQRALC